MSRLKIGDVVYFNFDVEKHPGCLRLSEKSFETVITKVRHVKIEDEDPEMSHEYSEYKSSNIADVEWFNESHFSLTEFEAIRKYNDSVRRKLKKNECERDVLQKSLL